MDDTNYDSATPDEELNASAGNAEPVEQEAATSSDEPLSRREALLAAFKQHAGEQQDTPADAAEPPTSGDQAAGVTEPAPKPLAKAPQSWTPATRALFDTLPPEIKQEVTKREADIQRKLSETAQERRIAADFLGVAQPYEAHFRSIGVHPIKAAQELFNTGYVLHTGSQQQKAKLISQMVKNFNVDLNDLDHELDVLYNKAQPKNPGIAPELDQRIARIEQTFQSQAQQEHQRTMAEINKTIESFASDPKNEYFNDVAPHMIALLQGSQAPDLQSAYDQACWANPAVRRALLAKDAANKQRLSAGNTSLANKGPRSPLDNVPTNTKGKSTRDILERLIPKD